MANRIVNEIKIQNQRIEKVNNYLVIPKIIFSIACFYFFFFALQYIITNWEVWIAFPSMFLLAIALIVINIIVWVFEIKRKRRSICQTERKERRGLFLR